MVESRDYLYHLDILHVPTKNEEIYVTIGE